MSDPNPGGKVASRAPREAPREAADASTSPVSVRSAATARTGPRAWLKQTADKVPTAWLISACTAIFLAGTAAFGGLNTATAADAPSVDPGTPVETDRLTVVVHDAWITDSDPERFLFGEPGDRFVLVEATVTNAENWPLAGTGWIDGVNGSLIGSDSAALSLSVHTEDLLASVIDPDTGTIAEFPPDVPITALFVWPVAAENIPDSDVALEIWNRSERFGSGGIASEREMFYDRSTVAARVPLRLRDEGGGS